IFCLSFILILTSRAQTTDADKILPFDEKIRTGKLENGLKYYIRYNKKPEKRIEMRLAVDAGSILEDEDQLGLAHFVEHMCFNGTKNFEKNELISYLQSVGIKFGPDVNAYTSFDETVYMLTIPSDSTDILNKGYLVMEDWAHNVSFENEEIDKERGVIIEEWRLGRGPWQRMRDEYLPVLFKESRYADRLPIGKKEIIENSDYETLKRFYHDWYRPDLMAFIVVGDMDVDETEAKIKQHFSNLNPPESPRPRSLYEVPDHDETLVSIAVDKECPLNVAQVFYKSDAEQNETYGDYRRMLINSLLTGMLNQRLSELTEKPEPPFINAETYYGSLWARTKYAFQASALVAENGIQEGLQALFEENLRVRKHGFTEGELERYKSEMLRFYEKHYNERDKTESSSYASEYIRNFLEDEPVPGIEFEYAFALSNIPGITLEEVNSAAKKLITDGNRVIVINAPDKENIIVPSEDELLALVSQVEQSDISPYADRQIATELMENVPQKGSIIEEKKIEEIDVAEIKLSNGVRVVLKSTDFKNDEILMSAFSPGGHSLYPDEDHQSAINADGVIEESGVSSFSVSDLSKILAGKTVGVSPSIGYYFEGFGGSCSPGDLESMFKLIYLYFTKPREDTSSFQSFVNKQKGLYKNLLSDPMQYYFDQYRRIKNNHHPRAPKLPSEEDYKKIDFNRTINIYKDRFADASDFTFFFVGAFNTDSIKPLIETYLGSLPDIERKEMWRDLNIRTPEGKVEKTVKKGMDPKSYVAVYFDKEIEWNERDEHLLWTIGRILNRKYIEILREEMSGIYGISTSSGINKIPYSHAYLQILFPCSPSNIDSLTNTALKEIIKIQEQGVSDEDLNKAKEIQRREIEENIKKNRYWLNSLRKCYLYGTDFSRFTDYDKRINAISSGELKRVANEYIDIDEYVKVVLLPEGDG
ncbi:MAG: insulinase family protein, partial [Bacteroidales bacterium]